MSCTYLLDANVFIQAHRILYPFDVFPTFWEWLEKENEKGIIASIEPVYKELNNSSDADRLSEWSKSINKESWFLPVENQECQKEFKLIANWTYKNKQYNDTAKAQFLDIVDSLIIAKAKSLGITVVTQEKPAPGSKSKIFIPDVCNEFGVPYIDLLQLFRILKGQF